MRLWSIHPKYLDSKGLVAVWRESLLAQKVLKGNTRGYKNHPQLERFKDHQTPELAISKYLYYIYQEANNRNYNFDLKKIEKLKEIKYKDISRILVTKGQILYEINHLKNKLRDRNPVLFNDIIHLNNPRVHPLFKITEGDIAKWEKI